MLVRTIACLRLIYLADGHCHLEQPTNAMSWMEPEAQDFVAQVGIFCVVMAACAYDQSWDKSWLFSSSLKDLTQMGAICKHPRGTHESVIGTRAPDGSFNSRKTSEYPKKKNMPNICQNCLPIDSPKFPRTNRGGILILSTTSRFMGDALEFRRWRRYPITPRLESPKSYPSGCVSTPSHQIL